MMKTAAIAALAVLIAQANVVQLSARLSGQSEVGALGATDATGNAAVTVNPATGQVCYDLSAQNLGEITGAHIHKGKAGEDGPPVVPLPVETKGMKACVDANAQTVKSIAENPASYYVNLHTAKYPAGAIRGQLVR